MTLPTIIIADHRAYWHILTNNITGRVFFARSHLGNLQGIHSIQVLLGAIAGDHLQQDLMGPWRTLMGLALRNNETHRKTCSLLCFWWNFNRHQIYHQVVQHHLMVLPNQLGENKHDGNGSNSPQEWIAIDSWISTWPKSDLNYLYLSMIG